jgi:NitT/TauT family transport system substrate-binding protein
VRAATENLLALRICAISAIALACVVPACSTASGGTRPRPPARQFKASASNDNFEWFFLVMDEAKAQGIWANHGLDPVLVQTAATAAQLKERVDSGIRIGLVNTAEVLLARSKGARVKVIAGYFGETSAKIYVSASGALQEPNQLDGKRVGILATTHTSYRSVLYVNKKLGVKAEPVPLGTLANNLAALKSGDIDAFYSAEGAAAALVDSGELRVVLPLADVYPKPYTAVVIWATDDLIENDPRLVGAFVQATLESVKYVKENPDHAAALLATKKNVPKAVAARIVAELTKVLVPSGRGSGQDLAAAVEGNWKFTQESGAVPPETALDVSDAVDARFLP